MREDEAAATLLLSSRTLPSRPSAKSLPELARIRGAMWTQRLAIPFGPRPGQANNVLAMDYYQHYSAADRKRMIDATKKAGYTHAVTGPIIDPGGYHGHYPSQTIINQQIWDTYLDAMEEWHLAGLTPIHFVHPDGWSLEQTRELLPFYRQPRARRLLPILVPAGWEPTQYGWSSQTWALFGDLGSEMNPDALILLHTCADTDAPVGTDERGDDNGRPNAEGWHRVAPHFHGWLIQLGGFVFDADRMLPSHLAEWRANLAYYFTDMRRRFHEPAYRGWPNYSKWGSNSPLLIYNSEDASYAYWHDGALTEDIAQGFGDLSMANGADGYLDAGTVAVPRAK